VKETDLAAYAHSVEEMAALAGKLDAVLPSHNEPLAKPEVLPRLLQAMKAIQSGSAAFHIEEGLRKYTFEGFSILVADKQK
jgi:hypothetical protein